MTDIIKSVVVWFAKAASSTSGPSTARVAFLTFVLMGAVWLSYDLVAGIFSLKVRGIHPDWVLAFGIYSGACTGGYIGGKVAGRPSAPVNGAPTA